MPSQVKCPKCQAALQVPDTVLGQSIRCPKCHEAFATAKPITTAPAKPAARRDPGAEQVKQAPVRKGGAPERAAPARRAARDEEDEVAERPRSRGSCLPWLLVGVLLFLILPLAGAVGYLFL